MRFQGTSTFIENKKRFLNIGDNNMATKEANIHDYAESLQRRLSLPLGLLLEPGHYTRLNLIYWKTPNADACGHRHRFIIRQGDGLFDSLFGDQILNGAYDEKLVLGAGRRDIVVHDLANYDEIASAIRAVNKEFGLDFIVRKIEEESFHRA